MHHNAVIGVLTAALAAGLVAQQAQPPVFRTGTDPVVVDVQVVTRDGTPVRDLSAADFVVEISGRRRPVTAVEFIEYAVRTTSPTASPTAARVPDPIDTPRPDVVRAGPPRTYVIAVDESSFRPASMMAYRQGILRFIEQLDPTDLAGLYTFPGGGPLVSPTLSREELLAGVDRLSGRFERPLSRYRFSLGEGLDITAGDRAVLRRVAQRECPMQINPCLLEIPIAAHSVAVQLEAMQTQALSGLRAVLRELATVPDRKTVVLVSGGVLSSDRVGSRGVAEQSLRMLGEDAARANLHLYVLHLDSTFLDSITPQSGGVPSEVFRDESLLRQGLEQFAAIAGGELFRAQTGVGDNVFARILRETSSYYLLAVDPEPRLRDGRAHRIEVKVTRPQMLVRSRPWVTIPRP